MGLLRIFLGFDTPITEYLETAITQAIIDRYKQGDITFTEDVKNFTGDVASLPKKARRELDSRIEELFSAENKKVKQNWKEFEAIIEQQIRETIKSIFAEYPLSKYSQEYSSSILAMSKNLLLDLTTARLPEFLKGKIQFADMDGITLAQLAKYATTKKFDDVLISFRKNKERIHIYYQDYLLVQEIKDDHYYINNDEQATRNTMLFFSRLDSAFSSTTQRELSNQANRAREKWLNHAQNRPDDRRFLITDW